MKKKKKGDSMKLLLKRIYKGPKYTIGHLYLEDEYVCDTIEDVDRGMRQEMRLNDLKKLKIKYKTAIPTGTYKVTCGVVSPKFSKKQYYKDFCGGKVPRLLNVPAFEGILIHRGKNELSSAGCIIVGYNKIKGLVINSLEAFEKLYMLIKYDLDLEIKIK